MNKRPQTRDRRPEKRFQRRIFVFFVSGLRSQVSGAGFSLIELVISLGIMSIGLVGAMQIFPLGLRASQRTEMASRATIIASRTMEGIKLRPVEDLVAGTAQVQDEGFTVVTQISDSQIDVLVEPQRVHKVLVTVSWDQNGKALDLSFVTYIWGKSAS